MLKFLKPRKKLLDVPIRDDTWLVVNVETTGLNPSRDRLFSIGWVTAEGRDIVLEESGYLIIRLEREEVSVGESAMMHGLTGDMAATGVEAEVAVGKLLETLRGQKLLAHYARMEIGSLDPLCRKYFDARFSVPVVDTIIRGYNAILRTNREPVRDELRLWLLYDRYGVLRFKIHHAFNDALACTLVWLAQESRGV